MPDTLLAEVLSSEERWKMLELLMTGPLSDSQLSKSLGVSVQVVRRHLTKLMKVRLVDVSEEKLPSGKAKTVYRATTLAKTLGFPPRKYEQLSEALISGLVSSLGERSARMVLRDIALKIGEDIGKSVLESTVSDSLSMDEYSKLVVNGLLVAENTYPKLLSQSRSGLVFEQFNCPYLELAERMPALVCDVLDEGVHEGLDRALNVRTVRLSCRGHGDVSCRFRVAPRT